MNRSSVTVAGGTSAVSYLLLRSSELKNKCVADFTLQVISVDLFPDSGSSSDQVP